MSKINVGGNEVSLRDIVAVLTVEQFAEMLEDYVNFGGKGILAGEQVGKILMNTHRTLQACVIKFAFGIIYAMGKQEYTDLRNANAVGTARYLGRLRDENKLDFGGYV